MAKSVSFPDVTPGELREGDLLLTNPEDPAGRSVEWRINEIGADHKGRPIAWYTTGDGTEGDVRFEDLEQVLTVKRGEGGAALAGLFERLKLGRNGNGDSQALAETPAGPAEDDTVHVGPETDGPPEAAPGTVNNPVVPETVDDIDPDLAPLELCAPTAMAEASVAALCAEHPELPDDLPWKFFDDGVLLDLDLVQASDYYQRTQIYYFAAILGEPPDERHREPADGYSLLSVSGEYEGIRITVQATVTPDPTDGLDRIYQQMADRAPTGRIPALDEGDVTALPAAGAT